MGRHGISSVHCPAARRRRRVPYDWCRATGTAAQATPAAATGQPCGDLGLLKGDITVTDAAFKGVPSELTAGWYVTALTNASDAGFLGCVAFVHILEGMTTDALVQLVAPADASTLGTVDAAAEASPAAEVMGPPTWHDETMIAGGPCAAGGDCRERRARRRSLNPHRRCHH